MVVPIFPIFRNCWKAFNTDDQYAKVDQELLALLLKTDSGLLASIHPVMPAADDPFSALEKLGRFVEICSYIGIGGDLLPKIAATGYEDLQEAASGLLAAFRAKYQDEEERQEKLEPYQDHLRTRKRDALSNYLIHSGFAEIESEDDLFYYFLIDTELEGCARTSRLVAATMSLQLYIHRIKLNLEQDRQPDGTEDRLHVLPSAIPDQEWAWRKNYRVWEANRKVFLYPENYIEPELRDNKTPLFKELETELLQQEINADNVLAAYGKYMRGFDELAHMKIAGSFHEKDEETKTDALHLFGTTAENPPVYYYRRVANIYYSEKEDNRGVVWGPWEKINVQIPVRKVAPIIFNGRLHVFWVKTTSLANNIISDARSIFRGYDHKYSIEFTTLKLDGTWTPPQKLTLKNCYPFYGEGIVQDPLLEEWERERHKELEDKAKDPLSGISESTLEEARQALEIPRYGTKVHHKPMDGYTLSGLLWDQVYPSVKEGYLILTGAAFQMRASIDFYNLSIQHTEGNKNPSDYPALPTFHEVDDKDKVTKVISNVGEYLSIIDPPNTQYFENYAYTSLVANLTGPHAPIIIRHWDEEIRGPIFYHIPGNSKRYSCTKQFWTPGSNN